MTDLVVAVNVALAVLWSNPGPKREYDSLICEAKTDPAQWADGMDTEKRLWLVGKVETQVLYGERLLVLERDGNWLKVAAVNQSTSNNSRGYPGWIPAEQVICTPTYLEEQLCLPTITVTANRAIIYSDETKEKPLLEVSYQTTLPVLTKQNSSVLVRLPDGKTGYLAKKDLLLSAEKKFSAHDIISEARRFIGLRYIWGGTSSYGFDCSGFAMRIYQSQGITIPRDADDQYLEGIPIPDNELVPGDLLFFATNKGQGEIHHVGIYSGGGLMIHAPNSQSAITEESYTSGKYGEEFCGARRYNNHQK